EPEREARAAGGTIFNRNDRHMSLGNSPHDCKAESSAAWPTAIPAPETTKQKFALTFVDARTLIKHGDRAVRFDHELNRCSPRGMVNRVLGKIANGAIQHVRITSDHDRRIRGIETDLLVLRDRQGCHRLDHLHADAV